MSRSLIWFLFSAIIASGLGYAYRAQRVSRSAACTLYAGKVLESRLSLSCEFTGKEDQEVGSSCDSSNRDDLLSIVGCVVLAQRESNAAILEEIGGFAGSGRFRSRFFDPLETLNREFHFPKDIPIRIKLLVKLSPNLLLVIISPDGRNQPSSTIYLRNESDGFHLMEPLMDQLSPEVIEVGNLIAAGHFTLIDLHSS